MARYRKKPVEVEAIQWTGDNLEQCQHFLGNDFGGCTTERHPGGRSDITVLTLEGQHIARLGDYLIQGVQGEHYPCRPDIFESTYEKAQHHAHIPVSR